MARMTSWLRHALVGAACLSLAAGAMAEDKASREREALRRAQQALRTAQEASNTLERDKTQLTQEKEALTKEKERLSSDAKRTAGRLDGALAQARAAQSQVQSLEVELAAARQEITALKETQAQQQAKLADAQRTVSATRALLERSTLNQRILEERNKQLYETSMAVVEMYRSRRPAETLLRQEPILGLGRVTIENVSEKWIDRIEAARYLDQDKLQP